MEDNEKGIDGWSFVFLSLALGCLVASWWYLFRNPGQDFDPMAAFLINIFLTTFSLMVGIRWQTRSAEQAAEKRATREWIRQAEGVVERLLNLRADMVTKRQEAACACDTAVAFMPGMEEHPDARALHAWIKTDCDGRREWLNGTIRDVDSAVNDWARFIRANCTDIECYRVNKMIAGARGEELPKPPWEAPGLAPKEAERIRLKC